MADAPPNGSPPPPGASGKAIAALVMGILSLICCGFFAGIPAIIVGRSEMTAIREGRSPIAGESVAKVGYILGIIGTIFSCLVALGYLLVIALGLGAGLLEKAQSVSAAL